VIAHEDRLARCGVELLAHLCETHGCQNVVRNTESPSPEQELLHCFSSRLYGLRNYRKAIQKAMTDGCISGTVRTIEHNWLDKKGTAVQSRDLDRDSTCNGGSDGILP
jgi:hypothetical protein